MEDIIILVTTSIALIIILLQIYKYKRADYIYVKTSDVKSGYYKKSYYNKCYKKVRDLRLIDYHIASAYRPYQIAGQTNDICSHKGIERALQQGARLHYLDVWSSNEDNIYDSEAVPVIRNSTINGEPLDFNKVCEQYTKAWDKTKDPLILYLYIHPNAARSKFILYKIARDIFNNFKERLLGVEYSFAKRKIGNISIKKLMGKVVIITNIHANEGNMQEVTNGIISSDIQNSGRIVVMSQSDINNGGISSTTFDKTETIVGYNKTLFSIVLPEDNKNFLNTIQPGIDLIQIPAIEPMKKYGFSSVCINYQLPGKIKDDYINFFKESNLVVKDESLREIPCPPPTIIEQSPEADLTPKPRSFGNGMFTGYF
jgi:hypothetical protein